MASTSARDRHDEIHDAQDDDVDDAAEGGRGETERHADHGRDHHHRQADEQRDARAIDDAREHVATQRIGAEREPRVAAFDKGRRQLGKAAKLLDRRMWREQRREHRDDADGKHDREADHGTAILAEGSPELEERAGLGLGEGC